MTTLRPAARVSVEGSPIACPTDQVSQMTVKWARQMVVVASVLDQAADRDGSDVVAGCRNGLRQGNADVDQR